MSQNSLQKLSTSGVKSLLARGVSARLSSQKKKTCQRRADSLRLTRQRCRDEIPSHQETFAAIVEITPDASAATAYKKKKPLPSLNRGTKLKVTFNPNVVAVSAEDSNRIASSLLCANGKDTRSRLRSLTRMEKTFLYATREDLKPVDFQCVPTPVSPPPGEIAFPMPKVRQITCDSSEMASSNCDDETFDSSKVRDSLDRKTRDSLDQKMWQMMSARSFASESDSENDSDSDVFAEIVGARNSLDMRRMRSSSCDLDYNDFDAFSQQVSVGYV